MKRHHLACLLAASIFVLPISKPLGAEETPGLEAVLRELKALSERMTLFERRLENVEASASEEATDIQVERHELEALQSQIGNLEESLVPDTVETSAAPLTARDQNMFLPSRGWLGGMHYGELEKKLEIHAFVDLEYINSSSDGSRDGNSTFDNHHANLFAQARLRPNLFGHIEFEFEHGGDAVEVDQAFVSWAISQSLSLDMGRFYTPFGIERFVWYSPTNTLISRPEAMRRIVPGNFYANGLLISGHLRGSDLHRFTYEVAISDGLGGEALEDRRGSRQNLNNNDNRAVSGRISYARWPFFEFGASYHAQPYSDDGQLDLQFLGFDFSGRFRGWELRSEWVEAEVDRDAHSSQDESGWYTQISYSFDWNRPALPSLTLVSRFDAIDLDKDVSGLDDRRFWSLGLNAKVYEHFRLKLEYQFQDEKGLDLDNDTLYFQAVVDF